MTKNDNLLTADNVTDYLEAHGLLNGPVLRVEELAGGVSNVVLGVDLSDQRFVIKQSLPELKVAELWEAKQERTLNEAAGLEITHAWTPEHVPELIHVDPARFVIVLERSSDSMKPWKEQLLQGQCNANVAATLGRVLATWHEASHNNDEVLNRIDDPEAFEQLRVEPFYRTVMQRQPRFEAALTSLIEDMSVRRAHLVHGDFSPKNILSDDHEVWVIDLEVAHRGDPEFDIGFLLSHLIAKAVHLRALQDQLGNCAAAFVSSYLEQLSAKASFSTAARHTGAILLSRVWGKSTLGYLSQAEAERVTTIGANLLLHPPTDLADIWQSSFQESYS